MGVASQPGHYLFELTVADDRDAVDTNTVEIVMGNEQLLLADAGLTLYTANDSAQLNGIGSHTEMGALPSPYFWKQVEGPYLLIVTGADTASPVCRGIVPDESIQRFTLELTVEGRAEQSEPADTRLVVLPNLGVDNRLHLENEMFDPLRPTLVFFWFDGFYASTGTGYMAWDSEDWSQRANAMSVDFMHDAWPEDPQPRSYSQCGDVLMAYLHGVAPMYDQPIQLVGLGAGGMVAIEVAQRLNLLYQDARYFANRVTLLCFGDLDFYPL